MIVRLIIAGAAAIGLGLVLALAGALGAYLGYMLAGFA